MLTDTERAILEIESQFWTTAGAKEARIRERLGLSPTRYYQKLNQLLDTEAALAHDATMTHRAIRLRSRRRFS